jgi:hypothetical protein
MLDAMRGFALLSILMVLPAAGQAPPAQKESARRLESVTWDPIRHELLWVVSKGKVEGDQFKAGVREKYEINIDQATMSFSDETRRFSKNEAESVRRLLDFLTRYTAESTIWWEKGFGEVVRKGLRVSNNPFEKPLGPARGFTFPALRLTLSGGGSPDGTP